MTDVERCACGEPLHYTSAKAQQYVEHLIATKGATVTVTTADGSWKIPRHYLALHGLRAEDVATLAARYAFEPDPDPPADAPAAMTDAEVATDFEEVSDHAHALIQWFDAQGVTGPKAMRTLALVAILKSPDLEWFEQFLERTRILAELVFSEHNRRKAAAAAGEREVAPE